MSSVEDLRREVAALRAENEQLQRRAADAEQAVAAFARGEVDAVTLEGSATPLLLRAAQEKLRGSQELLRAVFDGALDSMVLTDEKGRFVDANPAACALYGLTREELIGRHFTELTSPEVASDAQKFRNQGYLRGNVAFKRADGIRQLEFCSVSNVAPGLDLSVMRDTTERAAAEAALRRNERLFRAVIEKSAEAISLTAADGTTRYLTPSAWRLLGWTPEEMGSRTLRELVLPEDRERIAAELGRLTRSGVRDMSMDFRVQHRDGSILWIESSGTNLLDDPDVGAIVGNYRDITARKRAEEELRESRDRLEEAQAIAHVGSFTSGLDMSDDIDWSPECCRIFDLPHGTTLTVGELFEHVAPADREELRRANIRAIEENVPVDIEHRVERADARLCWVHARASVRRSAVAGKPDQMVGTVQDISDRRAAVDALRASEERYRRIVESTSEGIWMYDAEGVTKFTNARMAKMLGYTVEEMLGKPMFMFMDDANRPVAEVRMERRRAGISESGEFRWRRKDGSDLWTSIQSNPILAADGRFEAGLIVVTDISERRRADEARSRLAAIVESAEDAIFSLDPAGRITSWNAGAEKLYGYTADEVLGQEWMAPVPIDRRDEVVALLNRVQKDGGFGRLETVRTRKDGTNFDVAITISAVYDAESKIVGSSIISRDLTERREAEEKLQRTEEQFRHAQKMEAVGRLAGGVAHDFNNLLSVILSYSNLSISALKAGDPLRNDLGEIQLAAQRATELTYQLLAFSRQQVLQLRVIDLNDTIEGMKSMLSRLLGEDVELTISTTPGVGCVTADPSQIEQVVMNLVVNARDALPNGGKVTIETANVEIDAEYVSVHLGVAPGQYVMLAVSDTGMGMDATTRARIFEPFFTTKPKGKGTGLGLSTVFGIVQQSGGHVGVYSEPGQGCTFKVYLPRVAGAADTSFVSNQSTTIEGGSETVLLVEDEKQVRAVACTILRRRGYHVLEASNGGEAFLISKDFPAKIDLLLTDVVMPRMSGRELAELLAETRPEMKVLFASGYTDDAIVHHGVLESGVAFLQKPFTPDALLRKIREVLDSQSRTVR